jgi:hypothetical protein
VPPLGARRGSLRTAPGILERPGPGRVALAAGGRNRVVGPEALPAGGFSSRTILARHVSKPTVVVADLVPAGTDPLLLMWGCRFPHVPEAVAELGASRRREVPREVMAQVGKLVDLIAPLDERLAGLVLDERRCQETDADKVSGPLRWPPRLLENEVGSVW